MITNKQSTNVVVIYELLVLISALICVLQLLVFPPSYYVSVQRAALSTDISVVPSRPCLCVYMSLSQSLPGGDPAPIQVTHIGFHYVTAEVLVTCFRRATKR